MVRKEPKPERKKLSMKTRLIIIGAMFALINLVFFVSSELSDESLSEELFSDETVEKVSEETSENTEEEKQFYKFNPPSP
ncbi:MAG: hypothetical protein NPMRD1_220010 [Nitrosopumilales archaeon]|jgi:hypothetical protein|nr:MAG: hypothetical protein NPMRD1_220010 [Nitrosopumilales archaeon]